MLVALGIFAVIGVISSQLLIQVVDLSEAARSRSERLIEIHRATEIIRRDIQQLVHRYVRDEYGNPGATVEINQSSLIQLTRRGWQNPHGLPRSELQRVSYTWNNGRIYRLIWSVLDRANDTVPISQRLLDNVTDVEIVGLDVSGNRHRFWPLNLGSGPDLDLDLAAIEVKLTAPPYGEIIRLWSVPLRMRNEPIRSEA